MSTKSPVSTICLVACANRASSRSIGGMLKNPGRNSSEAAQDEERDGADMAARDKIDHADKPATRIYPVLRLARLSKSGAGIGLDHWFRIRRNRYRDNRLASLY